MKYLLYILGCQMNKSDAERVASVLEKMGFLETKKEDEADLIFVLACSVRQSAIDRVYGKIRRWNQIKKRRPLITILSGCVMPHDKKKMAKSFDLILDINELKELPKKIGKLADVDYNNYFEIHPHYSSNFQAYVPISNGCNNFCTYCVVPYVRGHEQSRKEEEIINEVKGLIKKGYKESTLIGQNVNSYGSPKRHKSYRTLRLYDSTTTTAHNNRPFINLLKKINSLPGNFWLRFITNHPKDMTDELINTLPKLEKVCEYIHLPIQSGDDEILKQMNRHYTVKHYLKLIEKIRKALPGVAISTDIIVGFPSETEKQFQNTAKVMKKVKFDMAYIAQYSKRPGTAAAKLKDDIPKGEKRKREKILTEILKETALENNQKLVGQEQEVLVESYKNGFCYGKTRGFKTTKFSSDKELIGQFIKVKITKATPWGLLGEKI